MGNSGEETTDTPRDIASMSVEQFDALFEAAREQLEVSMTLEGRFSDPDAVIDAKLIDSRLLLNDASDWFRHGNRRNTEVPGFYSVVEEYNNRLFDRVLLRPDEDLKASLDGAEQNARVYLFKPHGEDLDYSLGVVIRYTRLEDDGSLTDYWYQVNETGLSPWNDINNESQTPEYDEETEERLLRYLAWAIDSFELSRQTPFDNGGRPPAPE